MNSRFMFVGVIFNNYKDTLDFCRSLNIIHDTGIPVFCVLVDNSDKEWFREEVNSLAVDFSFVKILRPPINLGYFGAFNYFFKSSLYSCEDVVVLCNNDLVFERNFCDVYSRQKYPDDVFVVCPDVITFEGIHQNPHVIKRWGRLARLKLDLYFTHYYIACLLRSVQRLFRCFFGKTFRMIPSMPGYLYMGIGACYILQPAFLVRFDHLDFPHFLYGEEAYLANQVHSAGGKLYYDPLLKVLHKESATLSTLPSRLTYGFGRDGYWHYREFY